MNARHHTTRGVTALDCLTHRPRSGPYSRSFRAALVAAADEMSLVLQRAAYSTDIKTRLDFSCAIFDRSARIIARSAAVLLTLLLVSIVSFTLVRFVPGDPGDVMYGVEGPDPATRAAMVSKLGLDVVGAALVLSVVSRILFGVLAVARRDSLTDLGVMAAALVSLSVPPFALALACVTSAAANMGMVARPTRSAMLEILGLDFIQTARAKRLSGRAIVYRHALRNALLPVRGFNLLGDGLRDLLDPRLRAAL